MTKHYLRWSALIVANFAVHMLSNACTYEWYNGTNKILKNEDLVWNILRRRLISVENSHFLLFRNFSRTISANISRCGYSDIENLFKRRGEISCLLVCCDWINKCPPLNLGCVSTCQTGFIWIEGDSYFTQCFTPMVIIMLISVIYLYTVIEIIYTQLFFNAHLLT